MNVIFNHVVSAWLESTVQVFYEYSLVPEGATFFVYKENHKKEVLKEAEQIIRYRDDVVSFTVMKGYPNPSDKHRLDYVLLGPLATIAGVNSAYPCARRLFK